MMQVEEEFTVTIPYRKTGTSWISRRNSLKKEPVQAYVASGTITYAEVVKTHEPESSVRS